MYALKLHTIILHDKTEEDLRDEIRTVVVHFELYLLGLSNFG